MMVSSLFQSLCANATACACSLAPSFLEGNRPTVLQLSSRKCAVLLGYWTVGGFGAFPSSPRVGEGEPP